jgi:hypothetical protein
MMPMITSALRDAALEARARRAAKRVELVATKSRCKKSPVDNRGGFRLVDPYRQAVVKGASYNLSSEDVIQFCTEHVGCD